MTDTDVVNDEFRFGEPARHPARLGKARGPRGAPVLGAKLAWLALGLLVAGVLAFVVLRGAGEAGRRIGDANSQTLAQIARAQDAAAQGTLGRSVVVAQTLYAERGSFEADAATLAGYDARGRFTSGSSNGPRTIAFASTETAFGAAVRSESGACWWLRTDATGVTTYGSGTTCTGQAAFAASAPSW